MLRRLLSSSEDLSDSGKEETGQQFLSVILPAPDKTKQYRNVHNRVRVATRGVERKCDQQNRDNVCC